jgi:hypothetical protein
MPPSPNDFHLEEYKILKQRVNALTDSMLSIVQYLIAGIAAVYTWLLTHYTDGNSNVEGIRASALARDTRGDHCVSGRVAPPGAAAAPASDSLAPHHGDAGALGAPCEKRCAQRSLKAPHPAKTAVEPSRRMRSIRPSEATFSEASNLSRGASSRVAFGDHRPLTGSKLRKF